MLAYCFLVIEALSPAFLTLRITESGVGDAEITAGNSAHALIVQVASASSLVENYEASQRVNDTKESWAVKLSLAANVLLLAAKLWAFSVSG